MTWSSLLLPLLLVSPAARGENCAQCSCEGWEVRLCAPHAALEEQVLAARRPELDQQHSVQERIAALEAVAALTAAHENAPSPAVVDFLALGLADPDFEVRRSAAARLGTGQHREAALEALLAAARELLPALHEMRQVYQTATDLGAPSGDGDKDEVLEGLSNLMEKVEAARAAVKEYLAFASYHDELAAQLAHFPDERSDRALRTLVEHEDLLWKQGTALALVELGSREGLRAAVGSWESWQGMRRQIAARVKDIQRERVPKPPSYWRGTKEQWKERQEKSRSQRLAAAQEQLDQYDAQGRKLHERLTLFAREHELPGAPAWRDEPWRPWRDWVNRNAAFLPESLGTLEPSSGD